MSVGGTDGAVAEGDAAADDAEASALDPIVTMLPDIHAGRAFALSQLGKFKDAVSAATSAIKAGKAMEAAVCVVFFCPCLNSQHLYPTAPATRTSRPC
jgi:hypothetical protein